MLLWRIKVLPPRITKAFFLSSSVCFLSSHHPSISLPTFFPSCLPALRLPALDDDSCRLLPQSSLHPSCLCGLWHLVQQPETGARDSRGWGFTQPVARLPCHGLSPASGPRQPRPPCSSALASKRHCRKEHLAGVSCRGADPALSSIWPVTEGCSRTRLPCVCPWCCGGGRDNAPGAECRHRGRAPWLAGSLC